MVAVVAVVTAVMVEDKEDTVLEEEAMEAMATMIDMEVVTIKANDDLVDTAALDAPTPTTP